MRQEYGGRLILMTAHAESAVGERAVVIKAGRVAAPVGDLHEFDPRIQHVLLQGPGDDRRAALRAVSLCHGNKPQHPAGRVTNMECTIPTSIRRGLHDRAERPGMLLLSTIRLHVSGGKPPSPARPVTSSRAARSLRVANFGLQGQ